MKVLKDCSFFSVIFIRPQKFCCDGIMLWVCRHQSVGKMVSYLFSSAMVSMLALSVVDPWVRAPSLVKPKTKQLVLVASLLRMQH
jgi:hypothetical protein